MPGRPLTFLKDVVWQAPRRVLQLNYQMRSAGERAQRLSSFMSHPASYSIARDPLPDHEQKQAALSYLHEAWAEARHDGVDGDCLAQASLFTALAELVSTYGEDAVAKFVEGLPARVRNGEFSLSLARQ
jgi:hypothetical protein